MEQLIKALKMAETDKEISAEIDKDIVRLHIKNVDDVIEITEKSGNLNVLVKPSYFREEVTLKRLEEIIFLLKKQANYKHRTYDEIQQIKKTYDKNNYHQY